MPKEYTAQYMLRRYHKRREQIFRRLGGRCAACGSIEKLEIDHIDKSKKSYSFSTHSSMAETLFQEEIKKCQLLCQTCHRAKTSRENTIPK